MIKFYKVFYTIFSLIVLCCGLQSQNTFVKIIDVESRPQYAIQLLNWNERYFIYQFNSCLTHVCDGISEISNSGEIIKSIEIPQFSGNLNTLHKHPIDNELILTGESLIPGEDNKFLIYKVSPDDFSIIDSIKIFDSSYPHVFKFQKGSGFYNNQFVISGSGRDAENSPAKSLIYFLNHNYSVDTLLTFQFTRGNTNIWEQYVDHDGLLTLHFWYDNFDEYEFRSRIIKINEDKEVVWDWVSPPIQDAIKPYGFQHSEGFTVVCLPEWNHRSNVNLVAINQDGTTRWSHFFPEPKIYKKRYPARVKEMRNGDILVMGYYDERDYIPGIFQAPFMCRYNKDGKLLWERTYFTDYGASRVSTGLIFDMIEHEDGRIMAVGQIREGNVPPYTDILILTTDADGCIAPGCGVLNKLNDLISETEEVKEEEFGVKVSPNPFHNSLLISSKNSHNKIVKCKVYNAAGVLLHEHHIQANEININTDNWPSGLYFLEYWMENAYQGFTKVIKI